MLRRRRVLAEKAFASSRARAAAAFAFARLRSRASSASRVAGASLRSRRVSASAASAAADVSTALGTDESRLTTAVAVRPNRRGISHLGVNPADAYAASTANAPPNDVATVTN